MKFELSYAYLISRVSYYFLNLLRDYEGRNDSIFTSVVVCQHADY